MTVKGVKVKNNKATKGKKKEVEEQQIKRVKATQSDKAKKKEVKEQQIK